LTRARLSVGALIAALYVAVSQLPVGGGRLLPTRPLYDGATIPPYDWVKPPPDLAKKNQVPDHVSKTFSMAAALSGEASATTADNQASVIFPPGGILAAAAQTMITVTITPLDPAAIAPPPTGQDYDGNAYEISAVYQPSGKAIAIPPAKCSVTNANACATVVLRYAFRATGLYVMQGRSWISVVAQNNRSTLEMYGTTDRLGIFVAAERHIPGGLHAPSQAPNVIAFAAGTAAIFLGTLVARSRARRKRAMQFRLVSRCPSILIGAA
jgi:hypothetical protein